MHAPVLTTSIHLPARLPGTQYLSHPSLTAPQSPLAPRVLDRPQQCLLACHAVLAAVAGEIGFAEFGAARGQTRGEISMRYALAGPDRLVSCRFISR